MGHTRDRVLPRVALARHDPAWAARSQAVPGIGPLHRERVQGAALPPKEALWPANSTKIPSSLVLAIES